MNYPFPDFVPVPSSETFHTISAVSLVIGILIVCISLILLFVFKRKKKKLIVPWICLAVGTVIIINHGAQLLFNL